MSNVDPGSNPEGGGRLEADLRVARTERDEALEGLRMIQRRMAAEDAGLDVKNNPQHRYFVERYDGELTPEAMRTTAETAGFIASAQAAQQAQAQQSTEALGRVTSAAASVAGGGSTSTSTSPRDAELREQANELMRKAKTRQGDISEVFEWARRAGVPFIGDDS